MKDHLRKRDFRVFFILPDGEKASLVVKNQPGQVAAANKTREVMTGSSLVEDNKDFRVTWVRALKQAGRSKALVEAAVVVVFAMGIPAAGLWQLSQIFTG